MYKLPQLLDYQTEHTNVIRLNDGASIPFDPANTDYANFKKEILAGEAQLENADGNTMTPEEAQAYIKELP